MTCNRMKLFSLISLSCLIFTSNGQLQTIDLDTAASTGAASKIFETNEAITSIADAGDINADGVSDVIIGMPYANTANGLAGCAIVLFGGYRTSHSMNVSTISNEEGFKVIGKSAGDNLGHSVSPAGDVNDDGIEDIVIGITGFTPDIGRVSAGAALVLYGKAETWSDIDLNNFFSGPGGYLILGQQAGSRFGFKVCGAGDVDNDGSDDILISADKYDSETGRVTLIYGSSSGTTRSQLDGNNLGTLGFNINGITFGDETGNFICGLGDLNGDGYDDFLVGIGSLHDDGTYDSHGAAYIVFGSSTNSLDVDLDSIGSVGFRILGELPNVRISSCANLGDLNSDGYADFAISVASSPMGRTNAGEVLVIFGDEDIFWLLDFQLSEDPLPVTAFRIYGARDSDYLVASGRGQGDYNDDGMNDILIGAPYADPMSRSDAGSSFIIYGTGSNTNNDIDLLYFMNGTIVQGSSGSVNSGNELFMLRDFDGDGKNDVLAYGGANDVFIVWGESKDPTSTPTLQPTSMPSVYILPLDDIDLAGFEIPQKGLKITGAAAGQYVGKSVRGAGDVNNDGYADLIIGVNNAEPNSLAYILFCRPGKPGFSEDLANFTSSDMNGFRVYGAVEDDDLGFAVDGAGDVNSDGFDDVIVGAPNYSPSGRTHAGSAVIIFGKSTGWEDIDLYYFESGLAGFWILGDIDDGNLGWSVSSAGDYNGDGVADVVISAPHANGGDCSNCGITYVILGDNNPDGSFDDVDLSKVIQPTVGLFVDGVGDETECGTVVSGAGDVNGDGFDDVLIGCPIYHGLLGDKGHAGTVFVLYGKVVTSGNNEMNLYELSLLDGFQVVGAHADDYLGYAVSVAGDFNGDSVGDFVLGARFFDPPDRAQAGCAYIIFGRQGEEGFNNTVDLASFNTSSSGLRILGAENDANLGWAVSGGFDLNGDGIDDVILSAYQGNPHGRSQAGAVYIIFGRIAKIYDDFDTSALLAAQGFTISGAAASNKAGYDVSSVGDTDGDGVGDVLIGAVYTSPNNRTNAGTVYLLHGGPSAPSSQPTSSPSSLPSTQPSSQPSAVPSGQPSRYPSAQPVSSPTGQPSDQPTMVPSTQPSTQPTVQPSASPTSQPSVNPSSQPSSVPTLQPTASPSGKPSQRPSGQPSAMPSSQPTARPTDQPTSVPSSQPTARPSDQPTARPTDQPTSLPSSQPTAGPSSQPTTRPSDQPTSLPSSQPTARPSNQPTARPSSQPTARPSDQPTSLPSSQPTARPSDQPTSLPSSQPTARPSDQPTSLPSSQPTAGPSDQPTSLPSSQPTARPSDQPTSLPSSQPTAGPSDQPTSLPSSQPTARPSNLPTSLPSSQPTARPSNQPTSLPSSQPTAGPSALPTCQPSGCPSTQPSAIPSIQPSSVPSAQPTARPTAQPTNGPTVEPSTTPSSQPTARPSNEPSAQPTTQPTTQPTAVPSDQPTGRPSSVPSISPTDQPTANPTCPPSSGPSTPPSSQPSAQPTSCPSTQPSSCPSWRPTSQPSSSPTSIPSYSHAPTVFKARNWTAQIYESSLITDVAILRGKTITCGGTLTAFCLQFENPTGQLVTVTAMPWDQINAVVAAEEDDLVVIGQWNGGSQYVIARFNALRRSLEWGFKLTPQQGKLQAIAFDEYSQQLIAVGHNERKAVIAATFSKNGGSLLWGFNYQISGLNGYATSVAILPNSIGSCMVGYVVDVLNGYIISMLVMKIDSFGTLTAIDILTNGDASVQANELAVDSVSGDVVIVGITFDATINGVNALITRLSSADRAIAWAVEFDSGGRDYFLDVLWRNSDIFVVGYSEGFEDKNKKDLIVMHLDAESGNTIRTVRISGPGSIICNSLVFFEDGLRIACTAAGKATLLFVEESTLSPGILPDGYATYFDTDNTLNSVVSANLNLADTRSRSSHNFNLVKTFSIQSVEITRWSTSALATVPDQAVSSPTFTQSWPENLPSAQPTQTPTMRPTTRVPSPSPSVLPSHQPSSVPSGCPSASPTSTAPSSTPTNSLSAYPTSNPTVSVHPTGQPSSSVPTITFKPMSTPTHRPTKLPTQSPSIGPSHSPTHQPPSIRPSLVPTNSPTVILSKVPTKQPNKISSTQPTTQPITQPMSSVPTSPPPSSAVPTTPPSIVPSAPPSIHQVTPIPTAEVNSTSASGRGSANSTIWFAIGGTSLGMFLIIAGVFVGVKYYWKSEDKVLNGSFSRKVAPLHDIENPPAKANADVMSCEELNAVVGVGISSAALTGSGATCPGNGASVEMRAPVSTVNNAQYSITGDGAGAHCSESMSAGSGANGDSFQAAVKKHSVSFSKLGSNDTGSSALSHAVRVDREIDDESEGGKEKEAENEDEDYEKSTHSMVSVDLQEVQSNDSDSFNFEDFINSLGTDASESLRNSGSRSAEENEFNMARK